MWTRSKQEIEWDLLGDEGAGWSSCPPVVLVSDVSRCAPVKEGEDEEEAGEEKGDQDKAKEMKEKTVMRKKCGRVRRKKGGERS